VSVGRHKKTKRKERKDVSKEKSGMKGKQTKATQPIFFREKKTHHTHERERERETRAVDRYIRRAQQGRESEREREESARVRETRDGSTVLYMINHTTHHCICKKQKAPPPSIHY
jgi:uncharacterized damage-inducible protein DinB